MLSLQIASQWFRAQSQSSQVLSSLVPKLHKMTFDFFQAIFLEIGFSVLSIAHGESLSLHQFTIFAVYNLLSAMRKELANEALSPADWTLLLRNSFTPVSPSLPNWLLIISSYRLPKLSCLT